MGFDAAKDHTAGRAPLHFKGELAMPSSPAPFRRLFRRIMKALDRALRNIME